MLVLCLGKWLTSRTYWIHMVTVMMCFVRIQECRSTTDMDGSVVSIGGFDCFRLDREQCKNSSCLEAITCQFLAAWQVEGYLFLLV